MKSVQILGQFNDASFGAKADSLNLLAKKSINVPRGVAVSYDFPEIKEIADSVSELRLPLIVRSSTNLEDRANHSMAGIFKSQKINSIDDLESAIRKVQAWSKSDQVQKFLEDVGAPKSLQTNLIVQEYISSKVGGVIVTNPENETFTLESGSSSSEVTDGRGVKEAVELSFSVRGDDKSYTKIKQALAKISKLFSGPLDIEWLEDESGNLYILQCRPALSKPSDISIVEKEIARLNHEEKAHNLYTRTLLPDLANPTPVTISLLNKIYASNGPFDQFSAQQKNSFSYVTTIFGRPYINAELINRLHLVGSPWRYYFTGLDVELKLSITGILTNLLHPFKSAQFLLKANSLLSLKKHITKPLPNPCARDASIEEVTDYIFKDLCPDIFQTSSYIQILEKQLSKRIRNNDDFTRATENAALPQWMTVEKFDPINDGWHLSDDENEIASPPLIDSVDGKQLMHNMRQMIHDTKKEQRAFAREEVIEKIMSNWDKTIVRNQLSYLDALHQRRTDLHDRYVQCIRLLHHLLKQRSHNIWYAILDEILSDNIPSEQILKQRKAEYEAMQKVAIQLGSVEHNWNESLSSATDSMNATFLSSGSCAGKTSTDKDCETDTPYILLTTSLSQDIIFNHKKYAGVITENGGRLSHVALMAREIGLPIVRVNSIRVYVDQMVSVSQAIDGSPLIDISG